MSNAMDPFEGNLQATPAGPRLECLDYGCRLQNTAGRLEAKEHLPVATIARDILEIVVNCGTDIVGQRKFQWVTSFALADQNASATPLYAVECQSDHIAGAHAIRCHQ